MDTRNQNDNDEEKEGFLAKDSVKTQNVTNSEEIELADLNLIRNRRELTPKKEALEDETESLLDVRIEEAQPVQSQNLNEPSEIPLATASATETQNETEQTPKTENSDDKDNMLVILGLICICSLIILVLVGIAALIIGFCVFSVHYNEIALSRNKVSGVVNTQYTYQSGLHFMMPWYELLKFNATTHTYSTDRYEKFDRRTVTYATDGLRIFTTDKLEINVSFVILYAIIKPELGMLYRKFSFGYRPIINKVIESTLMNEGQIFSINDYREKRPFVRQNFKERLTQKLRENHMNLSGLFMGQIKFPPSINELNLKRVLNNIYNEKAVYQKEEAILRQNTTSMVQLLRNDAKFEIESASSIANDYILRSAYLDYNYNMDVMHVAKLNETLGKLNFPFSDKRIDKQNRMSFCYLYALSQMKNLNIVQDGVNKGANLMGIFV